MLQVILTSRWKLKELLSRLKLRSYYMYSRFFLGSKSSKRGRGAHYVSQSLPLLSFGSREEWTRNGCLWIHVEGWITFRNHHKIPNSDLWTASLDSLPLSPLCHLIRPFSLALFDYPSCFIPWSFVCKNGKGFWSQESLLLLSQLSVLLLLSSKKGSSLINWTHQCILPSLSLSLYFLRSHSSLSILLLISFLQLLQLFSFHFPLVQSSCTPQYVDWTTQQLLPFWNDPSVIKGNGK